MPITTKQEVWDLLEDKLSTISEKRLGRHVGEAKLSIALLISAGRDKDTEWIHSNLFSFYCKIAGLYESPTRLLILTTLEYLNGGNTARIKQLMSEAE